MHISKSNEIVTPLGAGTLTTGALTAINAGLGTPITFFMYVGVTDNDVDMKLQECTDSAGTGATDVTGAAITTLENADDGKMASIEISSEKLTQGYPYVRAYLTIAGTTTGAVWAVTRNPRHRPPTQPTAYEEQVIIASGS